MTNSLQLENQKLTDQLAESDLGRRVDRYNEEIAERLLVELVMEIEKKRRQIELVSAKKDELLGIAAHDLRSPLTVILGAAKFLQNQVTGEDRELVQMIIRSSEYLLTLLNGILDVDSIEHGRMSIEQRHQNLLPILEKSLKNYSLMAQGKNIEIEYEKGSDYVPVLIDPIRMEQVFDNLLSNAVKYSYPGTKVTVSQIVSNGSVQIFVKDQGIGIRQDEMDELFTKFAKTSNKPTAGESSTGLGLAIVKKLVELHNGNVTVSSVYGKGSTFAVTLPILKEMLEEIYPEKRLPPTARKANDPMKVLLIDDSPGLRRFLTPTLMNLGLKVVGEASDGRKGLTLYEQLRPDLVFVDMVMPEMSGIEVLKHIKRMDPEAVVVMLTSMASRENVLKSRKAGAFAYVLKPFKIREIKEVVKEIRVNSAQ